MGPFKAYLADIWRDSGKQMPWAATLVVLGALVEGIGLLAILPLAALITGNADTELGRSALSAMSGIGLVTEFSRALALTTGFLIILAIRNLIMWRRDTLLFSLGVSYVDRWRTRLLSAIGNADWATVSALRRSDFEHAITNDVSRLSSSTDQMLRSAAMIALSVVQLGIIAALSPMLLILVFALLGVSLLFTLPLMRKAGRLGKKLTKSGRRIYGVLGDFMSSQKLARLNNAEADFLERFSGSIRDVRTNQTAFMSSQIVARGWFQMAAGVAVIAALLIGVFVLNTPLSVLAVTILVLARLVGPVQMIAQTGQSLANALPAFTELNRTLIELRQVAAPPAATNCTLSDRSGPASLRLENVSYTYPDTGEKILNGATFEITAGEIVALVGPSGVGKTTLLDITSGLLRPDKGTVFADGEAVRSEQEMRQWRDQLAYLPQDPFLFDASIKENLMWCARTSDEGDIGEAIRIAAIDGLTSDGREGLDIRAGERGQSLSGGERQRICLARALLRRPRLLILDEATNALDARLEDLVLEGLRSLRSQFSILLITHRAETLRHADRVLRLENGRVLEA
ncbi:ABC transporter ATP-binding protein [Pontixanthobacter gangjinensis]|uniref:ATP-binding cassette domain-containing protein n=1 Tax=Pontixanthobacter gangjinensis TaxID=1028742 RepID=A0A6I4SR29_9SPHN|nr:ABC transporter ATP-binding protein [Pontixanthobacter gangjinensis]MXO57600.1 ATP-binding cassette domain-containing protein [Pontixanthobacter gangjinensis]